MIVRHLTLPGEVRALLRLDPLAGRIQCRLLDADLEATDAQRQAVRDAALGACRHLAREHGVRSPAIEVQP